ncbi:MAG: uroporphyrinogen decarboxylase family protein [Dehalococcoidia bacterium]
MAGESMTPTERLWSAIRLEKPDRVPVVPTLLPEPVAGLAGLTGAQVCSDNELLISSALGIFDEYGGWDAMYPIGATPVQMQAMGTFPMKMKIPGVDLPDDYMFQLDEKEVMQPQDYEKIYEMGMEKFYYEDYLWRIASLKPDELDAELNQVATSFAGFLEGCSARDVQPFFLGYGLHPFFTLALMRSMVPFTQDLYYNPEPVERALKKMTAELIEKQLSIAKNSGIDNWLLTEERASAYFYPPAIFERFWWPYTMEIVDAFWAEGIVTTFHLDQCWDKNIPYFKELPRGSAILELDSVTDIFAAKEILRGHLCFHGDVPAAILALEEPEAVEAYCRKLIDEVGGDGGFILGSGCSVPPNVKPQNFRAMVETGRNYEFSR